MGREMEVKWGGGWRADVPDSVNVLDGVADLPAELFFIKLHLQVEEKVTTRLFLL